MITDLIYITNHWTTIPSSYYLSAVYECGWVKISHLVKNCPIKCNKLEKISDIYWYHLKES